MLQQAIQPTTIDRTPGAVQIFAGLRLLARVVVIYELVKYSLFLSVVVIPNSFFSGRAYVVCGRYVLTGQRFTKRKWRRAPWRPRQWSTRPRQFKLKSGAVSKYLERTHLWKKKELGLKCKPGWWTKRKQLNVRLLLQQGNVLVKLWIREFYLRLCFNFLPADENLGILTPPLSQTQL